MLLMLDLTGTAVFAISGAAIGVKYRLDVFGVCVLAFVAGKCGRGAPRRPDRRRPPGDGRGRAPLLRDSAAGHPARLVAPDPD